MGFAEIAHGGRGMTYTFHVVITSEAEFWHARCPALENYGAITRGETKEEALTHIYSALVMILGKMEDEGTTIPPDHAVPDSIPLSVEL
jgi:predicted RNase H-like HicB family nuclease